jgi:CHAD domain-containing protein
MAMKLHVEKQGDRELGTLVCAAAEEQLDAALAGLGGRLTEARAQDEAVHEVRKRLKEVRALVRLVREGLGERVFDAVNGALRDAGRPLSEVRDAMAVIDALAKLMGRFGAVHEELVKRRGEVRRRVIEEDKALEKARLAIAEVRKGCAGWKIDGGWETVAAGMERAYRKGRRAMRKAVDGEDDEKWHEWRKRVKDLRYQLEMLEPLWPKVMKAMAKEAHALTDLLGEDHDLAVLAGLDAKGLKEAIAERREALRKEARGLGARLFAEKAGMFVKRVHVYWREPEDADGGAAAKGD